MKRIKRIVYNEEIDEIQVTYYDPPPPISNFTKISLNNPENFSRYITHPIEAIRDAFNAAREEIFVDRFGKWKYPTFEDYLNSKNKQDA